MCTLLKNLLPALIILFSNFPGFCQNQSKWVLIGKTKNNHEIWMDIKSRNMLHFDSSFFSDNITKLEFINLSDTAGVKFSLYISEVKKRYKKRVYLVKVRTGVITDRIETVLKLLGGTVTYQMIVKKYKRKYAIESWSYFLSQI